MANGFYADFISRDVWAVAPEALAKLEAVEGVATLEQLTMMHEAFMNCMPVALDMVCAESRPLYKASGALDLQGTLTAQSARIERTTKIVNYLAEIERIRKTVRLADYAVAARVQIELFVQALKCSEAPETPRLVLERLADEWLTITPDHE